MESITIKNKKLTYLRLVLDCMPLQAVILLAHSMVVGR